MISRLRPTVGKMLSDTPARLMAAARISPNALTLMGLALNIFTAWLLATGHLFIGGFMVLFSGWFDMLDGALARMTTGPTRFGGMLDSTVDRLSEAALYLGLILFYTDRQDTLEVSLVYSAIIGSILVSYTRAKAEGLGFKGEKGLFARPERLVLLTIGLLLTEVNMDALTIVLWVLAAGANLTAFQRLLYVFQQARKDTD